MQENMKNFSGQNQEPTAAQLPKSINPDASSMPLDPMKMLQDMMGGGSPFGMPPSMGAPGMPPMGMQGMFPPGLAGMMGGFNPDDLNRMMAGFDMNQGEDEDDKDEPEVKEEK
jgi:hypothetical protein